MAFYRAFRFPWSGRPASPPAVLASLNDTSEETVVHASWNGATEVAAWRVLAGQAHRLAGGAERTIPAGGFESSTDPAREVRPRGRAGARLGRPRARHLPHGAGDQLRGLAARAR